VLYGFCGQESQGGKNSLSVWAVIFATTAHALVAARMPRFTDECEGSSRASYKNI
ncbi:unnamed protein product, partial [Porites lobata]